MPNTILESADRVVDALKTISDTIIEGERAMLDLLEHVTARVIRLEARLAENEEVAHRVVVLEQRIKLLEEADEEDI